MRFYIATGLVNAEHARKAAEVLRRNGHEQTYDWTTHGDIRHEGAERMSEVAFNELRAVRDAELVVALLPGGQGTHTELGVALATRSNKRIILGAKPVMNSHSTTAHARSIFTLRRNALSAPLRNFLKF